LTGLDSSAPGEEIELLLAENSFLRQQLQERQLLYAHLPLAVILVDRDFNILNLSRHAGLFVKEPVARLVGRKCFEAVRHRSSVCESCPVESAMATGEVRENFAVEEAHLGGQRYIHQIAVPILADAEVVRVLEIVTDRTETVILQEQLDRDFANTLQALARLIEIHDPSTGGHSVAVREAAQQLGRAMGLTGRDLVEVIHAAILHDIGKIGIPKEILDKNGPLTAVECAVVRRHPGLGEQALLSIERFARTRQYVRHHHERFDGTGYPDGLKGEAIPLGARILAVADSWAAMTADRSYRPALSREEARRELERGAGSQFDPRVVARFLELLDQEEARAEKGG